MSDFCKVTGSQQQKHISNSSWILERKYSHTMFLLSTVCLIYSSTRKREGESLFKRTWGGGVLPPTEPRDSCCERRGKICSKGLLSVLKFNADLPQHRHQQPSPRGHTAESSPLRSDGRRGGWERWSDASADRQPAAEGYSSHLEPEREGRAYQRAQS